MEKLTNKEEEIMQILWKLENAFINDILEATEAPKPHYNTLSTIVRILEDKGFVGHRAYGKSHQYFPVITKRSVQKCIEGFSSQKHIIQASKMPPLLFSHQQKKAKNEIVLIKNTNPATTAATAVVEITDGETVFIQSDQPVYFIDGKKVSKDELSKILPDEIQLIEINRNNEVENNAQDSRGTIRITTKRNNASVKAEQAVSRLQKAKLNTQEKKCSMPNAAHYSTTGKRPSAFLLRNKLY
ncbi:hypothetical protein FQR65_LT19539 [Abscondita terminalis]|nr:hypothetical protein FQR65_LT19539 [Abscondita terminalis]